ANETDGNIEGDEQLAIPLMEQVDRRCDNERWTGRLVDGENSQERLAGAGRQHDDAASAAFPPGIERFDLMGKRIAAGPQRPRRRLIGTGLIFIRDTLPTQVFDQGAVVARL